MGRPGSFEAVRQLKNKLMIPVSGHPGGSNHYFFLIWPTASSYWWWWGRREFGGRRPTPHSSILQKCALEFEKPPSKADIADVTWYYFIRIPKPDVSDYDFSYFMQYLRGPVVLARHIISFSEDVQY